MPRLPCAIATIALSLASGGCSLLFADAPPDRHETMLYFDCTSTPGLEVADGVGGLIGIAGGADTLSQGEKKFARENDGASRDGTAAFQFVTAGVFVGSAIYGIVVTENCNDAKEELRQRIIQRELRRAGTPVPLAPPRLPPPAAAPPSATEAAPPAPAPAPAASPPAEAPPPAPGATPPAPAPAPKPGSGSF